MLRPTPPSEPASRVPGLPLKPLKKKYISLRLFPYTIGEYIHDLKQSSFSIDEQIIKITRLVEKYDLQVPPDFTTLHRDNFDDFTYYIILYNNFKSINAQETMFSIMNRLQEFYSHIKLENIVITTTKNEIMGSFYIDNKNYDKEMEDYNIKIKEFENLNKMWDDYYLKLRNYKTNIAEYNKYIATVFDLFIKSPEIQEQFACFMKEQEEK